MQALIKFHILWHFIRVLTAFSKCPFSIFQFTKGYQIQCDYNPAVSSEFNFTIQMHTAKSLTMLSLCAVSSESLFTYMIVSKIVSISTEK